MVLELEQELELQVEPGPALSDLVMARKLAPLEMMLARELVLDREALRGLPRWAPELSWVRWLPLGFLAEGMAELLESMLRVCRAIHRSFGHAAPKSFSLHLRQQPVCPACAILSQLGVAHLYAV